MRSKAPNLLEHKVYYRETCAVFYKTADLYGGLSNMSGDYPLSVAGVPVRTSEALYQACRFPYHPTIQQEILDQTSPMAAKMKSKHYTRLTRADWDIVRVPIMAWCLRLKLTQHPVNFGDLLLATGRVPIVEASVRDEFWGAVAIDTERLRGANVLGCLLTALRDGLRRSDSQALSQLVLPGVRDFLLLNRPIMPLEAALGQAQLFVMPEEQSGPGLGLGAGSHHPLAPIEVGRPRL